MSLQKEVWSEEVLRGVVTARRVIEVSTFSSFFFMCCTTSFIAVQQSAVKSVQPRVEVGD